MSYDNAKRSCFASYICTVIGIKLNNILVCNIALALFAVGIINSPTAKLDEDSYTQNVDRTLAMLILLVIITPLILIL